MVTKRTEVTWQSHAHCSASSRMETYLRGEGREGRFGQRLLPVWWLPASCSARSKNAWPVSLFMNYPSLNRAAGAFCSPFFEYGWAFQFLVLHSLTHTAIKQRGIFCRISFMMQYLAASPPLWSHPWESSHSNTPKVVFNPRLRHFFWGGCANLVLISAETSLFSSEQKNANNLEVPCPATSPARAFLRSEKQHGVASRG